MGIELTTHGIGIRQNHYDNFVEQGIDCDITLPDYCPDIMRVLKCGVQNCITGTKLSGDRASADGVSKIKIIYADENNNIYCYEQEYPFSKFAELSSSFDGATLTTCVKTEYINCRAVSKRRLDIHGVISLNFIIDSAKKESVVSNADGMGIQLRRKGINVNDVVCVTSKKIQFSEVEEIGENCSDIGKVIFSNASPIITETKIIKGKALLKGEWIIKVIYADEKEQNESCTVNYSVPFNEIVEIENLTDECSLDFSTCVHSVTAEPKTDNDGNYRYLALNVDAEIGLTAYCPKEINIITDAYSTECAIDAKYTPMEFTKVVNKISDTFTASQSIDISSLNPQKLYAVMTGKPKAKCTFTDGKMCVNGTVGMNVFMIDTDGAPAFCEREAEFEYVCSVDSETDKLICKPQILLSGYSCNLNNGKLDFKCEINIRANVNKRINERVLTELEESENGSFAGRNPSLTIYFCLGDESVWDIARRYNTTVEEIMEENGLTADYLTEKTMLMIPVK